MAKTRVFVDTNVILEAFKTGCWAAICDRYAIETVEKCIEETQTGDPDDPRRVHVDRDTLVAGLEGRHNVSRRDLAALILKHPHCQGLDDGEQHLLAWMQANGVASDSLILISTADKAAIVATNKMGLIDSLVALETIARDAGVARGPLDQLAGHYSGGWLDEVKTKIRLGIIP